MIINFIIGLNTATLVLYHAEYQNHIWRDYPINEWERFRAKQRKE